MLTAPPVRSSRLHLRLILAATLLLLWGCAARLEPPRIPDDQAPGDYGYLKSYITNLITAEMKKAKVVGLSLAVVDGEELVWSEGFGYAVKSAEKPADKHTVYRVGSITKLFTAIAIMQLAERGRLDIDSSVATYLPEFSIMSRFPAARAPTLRDLLTHHGGIPSDRLRNFAYESPPPEDYATRYLEFPGLLAGKPSGESQASFKKWLNQRPT